MVINTMESSTWVYSSQCAECWTPNNFTSKENQNCWVSMFRQWSLTIITDLQINIMASQIFLSLLSSIIIWYQKKWNFKLTSLTEKPAQNLYTTMSLIVHRDLHQFTMELLGLSLNQITSTGLVVFKVAAF